MPQKETAVKYRRTSREELRAGAAQEIAIRAAFVEAHRVWLETVDALPDGPAKDAEFEWNRQRVLSSHLWGSDQDPEMYLSRVRAMQARAKGGAA
jgi:hypothetical protein